MMTELLAGTYAYTVTHTPSGIMSLCASAMSNLDCQIVIVTIKSEEQNKLEEGQEERKGESSEIYLASMPNLAKGNSSI